MDELYPSFDMPEEIITSPDSSLLGLETPKFDFGVMDVPIDQNKKVRLVTDQQAYEQWVIACVITERYEHAAYDDDFGVETKAIMAAGYDRDVAAMEIERSVIEALMVDERTVSISSNGYEWAGDGCYFDFTVESIFGETQLPLKIGGEGDGLVVLGGGAAA